MIQKASLIKITIRDKHLLFLRCIKKGVFLAFREFGPKVKITRMSSISFLTFAFLMYSPSLPSFSDAHSFLHSWGLWLFRGTIPSIIPHVTLDPLVVFIFRISILPLQALSTQHIIATIAIYWEPSGARHFIILFNARKTLLLSWPRLQFRGNKWGSEVRKPA